MTTFPHRLYQIYSASMMPFDGSTENKLCCTKACYITFPLIYKLTSSKLEDRIFS